MFFMVKEVGAAHRRRYERLRLHARNADRAFDLLPSIREIERAIQTLFEARGIEIETSEYDPIQCVFEEGEKDHE